MVRSSGNSHWRKLLTLTIIISGTLYIETMTGTDAGDGFSLCAFSLKDGSELWKTSQILSRTGGSLFTVSGNIAYAFMNEVLYAFKTQDGTILWSRTFPVIDNNGVITVAHGQVYLLTQAYFNQKQSTLQAINGSTGKTVWSEQAPSGTDDSNPMLVKHNNLYVPGTGRLFVFDQMTGKSITNYPLPL